MVKRNRIVIKHASRLARAPLALTAAVLSLGVASIAAAQPSPARQEQSPASPAAGPKETAAPELWTPDMAIKPGPASADIAFTDFRRTGNSWTCLVDGKPMRGILVMPEGRGPHPAILISHGLGSTAERFATSKAHTYAKWGFASIATDYTHAGAGSHTGAARAAGRKQASDYGASKENIRRARVCLSILRSLPNIDTKRLYAYGNSMGAFVTIGLAADAPDILASAAITAGGIVEAEGFPAPSAARAANIRTPFLIMHGGSDTTVPPQRSALLQQVIDKNRVPNERRVWKGVGHNLHTEESSEVNMMLRIWFTIKRL